jgi:hypothetical protein
MVFGHIGRDVGRVTSLPHIGRGVEGEELDLLRGYVLEHGSTPEEAAEHVVVIGGVRGRPSRRYRHQDGTAGQLSLPAAAIADR